MPAIVGFIGSAGQPPGDTCGQMLQSLAELGFDGTSTRQLGQACFGVQFAHTLPEDEFDRQPYMGGGGRFLLVADARVDNRDEIAASLGLAPAELAQLSDAELLTRSWERWNVGLTDRVLGDISLAVWDSANGELSLVRTPLSDRPLFYHCGPDCVSFASLPSALFAVPGIGPQVDIDRVAELLAGGIYQPGPTSFFRGVSSVPHGHAVLIKNGTPRTDSLWELGARRSDISVAEAGEAMRSELDRAVKARSRRRKGKLACQLSGGRDSGAVAASAARLEPGLLALTAAPRHDFPPVEDRYWLADESSIAAETARMAGLRHLVIRSRPGDLASLLDRVGKLHFQPVGNPVNLPWIAETCEAAAQNDATVLLTGSSGNFGLSLGGHGFLGEYWRERGLASWLRLTSEIRRCGGQSWKGLLSIGFGHQIPLPIYRGLRTLSGRSVRDEFKLPLLQGPVRHRAEEIRESRFCDVRAPASRRQEFARLLQTIEPADKYSWPTWGVDARDPTADRRFVDLCYSLPVEAFLARNVARPAYAAAFRNRVPEEVIAGRQAGYQAADWFESNRPDEIRSAFRLYAGHPLVAEMFDLRAIDARIDRWPRDKGDSDEIYDAYCNQLLGSLALASFIALHLPG